MPKLKTNRAAAKRFRKTAKGFKGYAANRRHNLGHKTRKVKRHARSGGSSLVRQERRRSSRPSCFPITSNASTTMARVKRGVTAGRRHKKVLGKAKGYYNARRKVYRAAKQAVIKAGQYAYRDRRAKKREFRALWITRINAAARLLRAVLQPHHQRPDEGRHRDRPQGAGGSRGARRRRVWRDRAAGKDRSRHRLTGARVVAT